MAETSTPSWSDISLDLASLVPGRLPALVDRVLFAAVCSRWRLAAREVPLPPPLPLLALPDGTVYSLPGSEPFHLPACEGYTKACGNWLLFSREDGCFLRNSFSNETVTLPPLSRVRIRHVGDELNSALVERQDGRNLTMWEIKVCLPHLIAARITFRGTSRIALCQPGVHSWWSMYSMCVDNQCPAFLDITFHQGKLFALDHFAGALFSIDVSIDHNTGDPWVSRVRRVINGSPDPTNLIATNYAILKRRFLVELPGRMLMVERVMYHRWKRVRLLDMVPRTWRNEFEVFEANFEQSLWSKVATIGDDQVLFLRRQCCRFFCVSNYKILGNRIFFLGDAGEDGMKSVDVDGNHPEESLGPCRVFDMRDRKVSNSQPSISWNSSTALATWLFPQGQE